MKKTIFDRKLFLTYDLSTELNEKISIFGGGSIMYIY